MKVAWTKEFWRAETVANCHPNTQQSASALQGGSNSGVRALTAFNVGELWGRLGGGIQREQHNCSGLCLWVLENVFVA